MMLYKSTLFIKCEKDLFKAIHRHYVSNWRVLYFCIDQCNLYLGNCTMPMRIYIPIKDWISLLLEFIEIPVLSMLYKLVFSTITFSISSFRNKLKYLRWCYFFLWRITKVYLKIITKQGNILFSPSTCVIYKCITNSLVFATTSNSRFITQIN